MVAHRDCCLYDSFRCEQKALNGIPPKSNPGFSCELTPHGMGYFLYVNNSEGATRENLPEVPVAKRILSLTTAV